MKKKLKNEEKTMGIGKKNSKRRFYVIIVQFCDGVI